jgi:hypothetical protein
MVNLDNIDQDTLATYEALFIDAYRELYPDYEWAQGSMLYEMVIRPAAIRAASDEEDLSTLRQNMSLYLASIAEEPDQELVSSLASNFRVESQEGLYATGEITVYTRQNSNVYIPAGSALNAGGLALTVERTYVGVQTAEDYVDTAEVVYKQYTPVGAEFAFTVPVRSSLFTDESVARGVQVAMPNRPVQVSRIETATSISGGREEASTADVINDALYGITAKVPSGNSHLASLFSALEDVNVLSQTSFGINDAECIRDRDNVFGISVGGRVDAYCKTAVEPVERTISVTATRATTSDPWTMFIDAPTGLGFYRIESIQHPESTEVLSDEDNLDVTYSYAAEAEGPHVFSADTARYSIYQTALVSFEYSSVDETETTFNVILLSMPGLQTLQDYINRRDVRNEAHDVLVRGPHPASVSVTVTVERDPGDTSTTESDIQAAVASAINATEVGVDGLDASLVVNAVEAIDETLNVVFPVSFQADFQSPDGTIRTIRTLIGRLTVPESDYPWVTERNTMYYCNAADVNATIRDKA